MTDGRYCNRFFTDYAFALTTGKVPKSLTPKFLIVNKEWLDSRVRRDSDSSISTYPLLTSEDKGEDESDITSVNLNVTQEDVSSSRIESLPDQQVASEVSDTEANDPDTVVQPVDDSVETSSSSEEEQENTTLKKSENTTTSENPRQLNQDVIPNVGTPASPWKFARPTEADHTPDRDSHPPTPADPFKQSDEQVPLIPPVPLVPSAPPVSDRPVTPAKVVTQTSRQQIPITPARKILNRQYLLNPDLFPNLTPRSPKNLLL